MLEFRITAKRWERSGRHILERIIDILHGRHEEYFKPEEDRQHYQMGSGNNWWLKTWDELNLADPDDMIVFRLSSRYNHDEEYFGFLKKFIIERIPVLQNYNLETDPTDGVRMGIRTKADYLEHLKSVLKKS